MKKYIFAIIIGVSIAFVGTAVVAQFPVCIVPQGCTGLATLDDGFVLLGSGTGAVTPLNVTAKGSLLAGDGTGDPQAHAVGADDEFLTASSGSATGLSWTTSSGSGDITDVFDCASGNCASIVVGATDLLDFSGNDSSTTSEGLKLPQHATLCATGFAEGQVCWEADANILHIGDAAAFQNFLPASAFSTDITVGSTGVVTIADSVTVTGWVMGASTGTTPAANDDDTSLSTTAYVQTEINALGGTGLTCSAGSCSVDLGTAIISSEITDNTIQAVDLEATNTEADNDIVTFDSGTGGFTFNTLGELSIQVQDAVLDDLSALGVIADNEFIVGTGAGVYANESGGTVRTSLGLVAGGGGDIWVEKAGDTLTGELTADDLGIEFTAGDAITDCSTFSATGGGIFFDDSEGLFKKCQDNVLSNLDTTGSGDWQTTSNVVNLVTSTDTVNVGGTGSLGKLAVDGDADEIQFIVQGHSTQTSDLITFEQSDGTNVFTVDKDGNTAIGAQAVGDSTIDFYASSTLTWTIGLDDSDSDNFKISTDSAFASGNIITVTSGGVIIDTASSLAIPQGSAPTVNAAGEIAVDTTDDQFIWYGGAKRVLNHTQRGCIPIEDLAAADDNYEIYTSNDAWTLVEWGVRCRGTCTTTASTQPQSLLTNVNTTTPLTGAATGTSTMTFDTISSNNSFVAGDTLIMDVTNTPTSNDEYQICIGITQDAQ